MGTYLIRRLVQTHQAFAFKTKTMRIGPVDLRTRLFEEFASLFNNI